MLPPSNSFVHQSHKLAEATTNLRNRVITTPPPPYFSTRQHPSVHEDTLSDTDVEDDDEIAWTSNPCPVTIHIDASINVLGNGNTIIIPSVTSPRQGIPSQPERNEHSTTATTSSSQSSPSSPVSTSATTVLQSMQKQRQTKLTGLATSIISALSQNKEDGGSGRSSPIEININTGVKIEGSRNVICAGTPTRLPGPKRNVQSNNKNGMDGDKCSAGKKRRAQSEPIETPEPKKGR